MEMRPISELGLEAIQLEDQVLLVDSKWKYKNEKISIYLDTVSIKSNATLSGWFGIGFINNHKEIIASTKPLEGLPILVIEDEVHNLLNKISVEDENLSSMIVPLSFKIGYNKAKETFKFTEEDLRKAMKDVSTEIACIDGELESQSPARIYTWIEKYIQSLTKKELWIEADCTLVGLGLSDNCHPKITEGKIKAVWK